MLIFLVSFHQLFCFTYSSLTIKVMEVYFPLILEIKQSEFFFILYFCYHGIVFHRVMSLLQILQLQLGDKVLRDTGTLGSNGVQ